MRKNNPIEKWVKNRHFMGWGRSGGRNGSNTYKKIDVQSLSLINNVENASSNHNEIAFHTHQIG